LRWGDKRRKPLQKDKGRRRVPTAPISKSTNTAVKRVCSVYFPLMHIVFPEPSSGGVTEVPPLAYIHTYAGWEERGGLKQKDKDRRRVPTAPISKSMFRREGGRDGRSRASRASRAASGRRRSVAVASEVQEPARAPGRRHSAYHLSILSDLILIFLICVSYLGLI
jgi:hypothetical protein